MSAKKPYAPPSVVSATPEQLLLRLVELVRVTTVLVGAVEVPAVVDDETAINLVCTAAEVRAAQRAIGMAPPIGRRH